MDCLVPYQQLDLAMLFGINLYGPFAELGKSSTIVRRDKLPEPLVNRGALGPEPEGRRRTG